MPQSKIFINSKTPEVDLLDKLRETVAGFEEPKEGLLKFDDTWQRWGKSGNFRFRGAQTVHKGGVVSFGTFMDWRNPNDTIVLRAWEYDQRPLTATDLKALKPKFKKKEEVSKEQFFKERLDSFKDASYTNPYLQKKRVAPYKGLKENSVGHLCVPVHDLETGKVVGIQAIKKDGGKKNFVASKMKGIFPVGEDTKRVYLCEGLADALTVHEITGKKAICCFGQHNLKSVAKLLANQNELTQYIICGDNLSLDELSKLDLKDHGEYHRYYASIFRDCSNIITLFPQGIDNENKTLCKDFNDLFLVSESACEQQLNNVADIPSFKFLGSLGGKIYVYSSYSKTTHEITENSSKRLYLLAPKAYWKMKFPGLSDKKIIDELFDNSGNKLFDPSKVRKAGMYRNKSDNKIIINTGEKIIGKPDKEYTYIFEGMFPDPKTLPDFDPKRYWQRLKDEAFPEIAFESEFDIYTLVAFTILSSAAKVLAFRCSLHFVSESSTGKSYLVDNLVEPLLSKIPILFKKISPSTTPPIVKEMFSEKSLISFEERKDRMETRKGKVEEDISAIIRDMSASPAIIQKKNSRTIGDYSTSEAACNVMFSSNAETNDLKADKERTIYLTLIKEKQIQKEFHKVNHFFNRENISHMGFEMIGSFLKNFDEFEENYVKFITNPQILNYSKNKGISHHKMRIYGQIFSLLETLNLLSKDELNKMLEYTKEKEALEIEAPDYEHIVKTILEAKIWWQKDNDSIRNIITDYITNEDERAPFASMFYHEMIKQTDGVCLGIYNNEVVLRIPKNSNFIFNTLKKSPRPQFASSFFKVLKQQHETSRYRMPKSMGYSDKLIPGSMVKLDSLFSNDIILRARRNLDYKKTSS